MPGPSISWSAFTNNMENFKKIMSSKLSWPHMTENDELDFSRASSSLLDISNNYINTSEGLVFSFDNNEINVIKSLQIFSKASGSELSLNDDIVPMILEFFDLSLLNLRYSLNLTIADISSLKPRKALSFHPNQKDWPDESIEILKKTLDKLGEVNIYHFTVQKLLERIQVLQKEKVQLSKELLLMKKIKEHTMKVALLIFKSFFNINFIFFFYSIVLMISNILIYIRNL